MLENLKITAFLQSAVIGGDPFLPLDGVILYQMMRERFGHQDSTSSGAVSADTEGVRMPFLRRWTRGRNYKGEVVDCWYYALSFAQWNGTSAEGATFLAKRFRGEYADLIDFKGKSEKVITERGRYKAGMKPFAERHALSVSWYAVADKKQTEFYLRFVTNLGKKPGAGGGAILRWEIETVNYDWSETNDKGHLMRAMPTANGGVLRGIRPSYWLAENQFHSLLPVIVC